MVGAHAIVAENDLGKRTSVVLNELDDKDMYEWIYFLKFTM